MQNSIKQRKVFGIARFYRLNLVCAFQKYTIYYKQFDAIQTTNRVMETSRKCFGTASKASKVRNYILQKTPFLLCTIRFFSALNTFERQKIILHSPVELRKNKKKNNIFLTYLKFQAIISNKRCIGDKSQVFSSTNIQFCIPMKNALVSRYSRPAHLLLNPTGTKTKVSTFQIAFSISPPGRL